MMRVLWACSSGISMRQDNTMARRAGEVFVFFCEESLRLSWSSRVASPILRTRYFHCKSAGFGAQEGNWKCQRLSRLGFPGFYDDAHASCHR